MNKTVAIQVEVATNPDNLSMAVVDFEASGFLRRGQLHS